MMRNNCIFIISLCCILIFPVQLKATTLDVELVCKKTTFISRGTVLAGFNKFKSAEISKKDNVEQLYRQYCFVNEERMTLICDEYVRLDRDTIWTKGGYKLDRKTLKGSLRGLGADLNVRLTQGAAMSLRMNLMQLKEDLKIQSTKIKSDCEQYLKDIDIN